MKNFSILLVATFTIVSCSEKKNKDKDPGPAPAIANEQPATAKEEPKAEEKKADSVLQAVATAIVGNDPAPAEPTPEETPIPEPTPVPPISKLDHIVDIIFTYLDLDKSDQISEKEFLVGLKKHFLLISDDKQRYQLHESLFKRRYLKILEIFKKYSGDGEMSREELREFLKSHPNLLRILFAKKIIIPVLHSGPDQAAEGIVEPR